MPESAKEPESRPEIAYAWTIYRQIGFNWQDLYAYCALSGDSLSYIEIEAIKAFERERIKVIHGSVV